MSRLDTILDRASKGEAVVMTAEEVCRLSREGEEISLDDVDVITAATRAVMSGTYAVLSFPVEGQTFSRARAAYLNGVPGEIGPCPNENLSILDMIVFGTARSREDPRYGGGHLFRDLVGKDKLRVDVETIGGRSFSTEIAIDEIPCARLFGTRHCFSNYSAFVNRGSAPLSTIFHASDFGPLLSECTFSGCGQINPLKCDPLLDTIGVGSRILMNGGEGFVIGQGTRSTHARPNLSGFADMHEMNPEYMGGFNTSAGPECVCSWAVPIPVISDRVLDAVRRTDREIPVPVMDVSTRKEIARADYGNLWGGVDLKVGFHPSRCRGCSSCRAEELCPTDAISIREGVPMLDKRRCFNCGLCTRACPDGVFSARLGRITLEGREIPVALRQSDRLRALRLARDLKRRIQEGSFKMTRMVEGIH
ncbi:MAG: methanogenesis marker 16 metalloprotein [Methanotrichaceae archaeon]|nr:methanogenesis marker 16 metalloprotein [Methanotrichaceae archaeon]